MPPFRRSAAPPHPHTVSEAYPRLARCQPGGSSHAPACPAPAWPPARCDDGRALGVCAPPSLNIPRSQSHGACFSAGCCRVQPACISAPIHTLLHHTTPHTHLTSLPTQVARACILYKQVPLRICMRPSCDPLLPHPICCRRLPDARRLANCFHPEQPHPTITSNSQAKPRLGALSVSRKKVAYRCSRVSHCT